MLDATASRVTASTGGSSSLGWLGTLTIVPLLAAFAIFVKRRARVLILTRRVNTGKQSTGATTKLIVGESDGSGKSTATRVAQPATSSLGEEKVGLELPVDLPSLKEQDAVREAARVMELSEFRV